MRSAGSRTAVPTSTRRTRLATAASNVNGSWRGRARSESPAQTESKPRRSTRSANSSSDDACGCPTMMRSRVGSKYPIRMDMAFSAPMNAVCLMIFCLPARIRLMEFLETTVRKRRYAAPALPTACAGQRAHRIPPGRSPGPRGVCARESEMRVRTECGCHRRRAAVASP